MQIISNSKRRWALFQLKRYFVAQLTIARGHKDNGVPNGDAIFIGIRDKVWGRIASYAKEFDQSYEQIFIDWPTLRELELLATPADPQVRQQRMSKFITMSILGSLFGGILFSIAYLTGYGLIHLFIH